MWGSYVTLIIGLYCVIAKTFQMTLDLLKNLFLVSDWGVISNLVSDLSAMLKLMQLFSARVSLPLHAFVITVTNSIV